MKQEIWRKTIGYLLLFLFIGNVFPISAEHMRTTLYVDDDAPAEWYDATHVKTIQEGIINASEGDTIFVFHGTYTENVLINKQVILCGEQPVSTIIDGNETHSVVRIGANQVTITGFTIQHCKTYYYGIHLLSDYCTVSGNIIINNDGYGIQLGGSEHNTITDNYIGYNSRGISLDPFSNHNIITSNTLAYNHHYSWNYGIVSILSRNITIEGNTFLDNTLLLRSTNEPRISNNTFTLGGISIQSESSGDYFSATIDNNTVNGKPIRFYKIQENIIVPENTAQVIAMSCTNLTIANLIFSESVLLPVHLINSHDCTIINNTISRAGIGIYLYFMCRNNLIENNSIANNTQGILIEFWSPEQNTIRGNRIVDNHENGIELYDSTKTVIEGNLLERNGYGIHLEPGYQPCYQNQILSNCIISNQYDGIRMLSTYENTIQWNRIKDNNKGFFLLGSDDNTIAENTIQENSWGIESGSANDNNILYHNNFIDNTHNAVDGSINSWDNSMLQEGNYWSDFITNPGYPHYYQIPGGNNIDHYPLATPCIASKILPDIYTIVCGRYVSGGLSDIFNSDDLRLVAQAGISSVKQETPLCLELQGTAPLNDPPWLNVTIETKANSQNIVQRISLYNYENRRWDERDVRLITTSDQVVRIYISDSPSQYINQTTGYVSVRILWKPTGPTSLFPWEVGIDQVVWNCGIIL